MQAVSRTSPSVMVRWDESVDWGTPFERRRAVSLDGVRATKQGGLDRFGIGNVDV